MQHQELLFVVFNLKQETSIHSHWYLVENKKVKSNAKDNDEEGVAHVVAEIEDKV